MDENKVHFVLYRFINIFSPKKQMAFYVRLHSDANNGHLLNSKVKMIVVLDRNLCAVAGTLDYNFNKSLMYLQSLLFFLNIP